MLTDIDKFKEYLNSHSLKQTAERIDIAKAVTLFDDTFTVDELMDKIIENGWPVSKATLYRSIPLLIESGMIKPIATHQLNNHTFKRLDESPLSPSFDCGECGNSLSVDNEIINDVNQHLANKYRIEDIINNLLVMNGVCPDCINQSINISKTFNLESVSSNIRILLFEDEELAVSCIMNLVKGKGIEVFPFSKPKDFNLDCSCNEDPNTVCADIIIADIKMPGMSGIEFIKNQIAKNCRIKNIAFISAYWTLEDLDYAGSIGAAIFHKPFDILELMAWIDQCIQNVHEERVLGSEFIPNPSV